MLSGIDELFVITRGLTLFVAGRVRSVPFTDKQRGQSDGHVFVKIDVYHRSYAAGVGLTTRVTFSINRASIGMRFCS